MKNKVPGIMNFALSLFLNHIAAFLITFVAINIINFFLTAGANVLQFLIGASLYFVMCYMTSWERGETDNNRMKLGLIKKSRVNGLFAGLIAAIPGFVLALFAFLAEIGAISVYDLLGKDVFTTLNRFWHLPISPLYVFANSTPALNFLFPLFLPLVSEFGYLLGMYGISLKKIFVYSTSSESDK